jgi:uncharacterized protein YecE (DUF72 family)
MPDVLIGCGPLPPKRAKALATFRVAELSEAMNEPIGLKTLERWHADRPAGFEFVLGASKWLTVEPLDVRRAPAGIDLSAVGLFRVTDANRALWDETRAQADALSADAVLFRSPPGFTPSQTNIESLRAFRREVIGDVPFDVAWEPRGIWSAEEVAGLCDELDMIPVRDPHGEATFPEPIARAYYAVTAPVGHLRFGEDDLYDLSAFLDDHPEKVRVVFRGPDRERNAGALVALRNKLHGVPASP